MRYRDLLPVVYKRLAGLSSIEALEAIGSELVDRFGELPDAAISLTCIAIRNPPTEQLATAILVVIHLAWWLVDVNHSGVVVRRS